MKVRIASVRKLVAVVEEKEDSIMFNENDSETNKCEENGAGKGRGCLSSVDCKFGDLGRMSHLTATR